MQRPLRCGQPSKTAAACSLKNVTKEAMTPEPQPTEFDPSEELTRLGDPDQERYGLSDRVFFYLIMTCRAVESFAAPAFTIDAVFGPPGLTPAGCWVEFIIKQAFWIDVSQTRVKLWTASADDADGVRNRYLVHDGDSSDPKAWDGLLVSIGRVEKFGVFINHADRLRLMWSEWVLAQRRLRDERGF
jgi:hypothetical protein